jgi:thiosulfate dehydrogenase [quinone] large subunit
MWSVKRPDGSVATGWFLVPLRLFMGVTFLYAGLQKLADPQFLKNASPTSIHAQLVGATHSSPIHALITHLVPIAPAVGLAIAIGEVAVGLGVLVGLWMRVAAVAGMFLSLSFFLSVSFHASPYFNGSDIVFLFAWTPFVLAGSAGAPAVDTWLADRPVAAASRQGGVTRRAVLSKGAVAGIAAAAVVIGGGLSALFGRLAGGATPSRGGPVTLAAAGSVTTTSTTSGGPSTPTTAPVPSGAVVGSASGVPVGGSAAFTDPATGDPSLVIQQTAGDFVAFDAICPHAGCTVAYQASSKIIACPCHGSEFNAKTGNVIRGPATYGLTPIKISTGPNGDLYVAK